MKIKATSNFRETRLRKGYTMVELASKLNMTKQALGQIERGCNGMNPSNSQKVLLLLEVEFDDIFEITE